MLSLFGFFVFVFSRDDEYINFMYASKIEKKRGKEAGHFQFQ